jgi:hypothetical protein
MEDEEEVEERDDGRGKGDEIVSMEDERAELSCASDEKWNLQERGIKGQTLQTLDSNSDRPFCEGVEHT